VTVAQFAQQLSAYAEQLSFVGFFGYFGTIFMVHLVPVEPELLLGITKETVALVDECPQCVEVIFVGVLEFIALDATTG
jgi:hypothetical protein